MRNSKCPSPFASAHSQHNRNLCTSLSYGVTTGDSANDSSAKIRTIKPNVYASIPDEPDKHYATYYDTPAETSPDGSSHTASNASSHAHGEFKSITWNAGGGLVPDQSTCGMNFATWLSCAIDQWRLTSGPGGCIVTPAVPSMLP
eukprot:g54020.t1